MKRYFVIMAMGLIPAAAMSQVVLDDFEGGVTHVNHPAGAGVFDTWYDATHNTFGTIAAGTLDGSPAGKITDGGFANGVYAIFQSAVPTTGNYKVSAKLHVTEDPAQLNSIRAYQVGVIVNGAHRPDGNGKIAPCPNVGNYIGLDNTDNSGLAPQIVTTNTFSATAGDNILIALSTDCDAAEDPDTTGAYDFNSGDWEDTAGAAFVHVDDITLFEAAAVNNWNLY